MNNRSRKLLDLAHDVPQCMNCGAWPEAGCEPAHENGIEAGKGQSIKSHDHRHAALCHWCHVWYDSGAGHTDPSDRYYADRKSKGEMWRRAHGKTMDYYWAEGWLKVA